MTVVYKLCTELCKFCVQISLLSSNQTSPSRGSMWITDTLPIGTTLVGFYALQNTNSHVGKQQGRPPITHQRQRQTNNGQQAKVHANVYEHLKYNKRGKTYRKEPGEVAFCM